MDDKKLESMNYDGNPPRCASCENRLIRRMTGANGNKASKMICALAQFPVNARGICDSWILMTKKKAPNN